MRTNPPRKHYTTIIAAGFCRAPLDNLSIPSPSGTMRIEYSTRKLDRLQDYSGSESGSEAIPMKLAATLGFAAVLALSATASGQDCRVKIGVLTDMSSLYSDIGGAGSVEAAKMAIADFGGTVNRKRIELFSADHKNNRDLGAAIGNQWFGYGYVDAIVDVPTSSVALARPRDRTQQE